MSETDGIIETEVVIETFGATKTEQCSEIWKNRIKIGKSMTLAEQVRLLQLERLLNLIIQIE